MRLNLQIFLVNFTEFPVKILGNSMKKPVVIWVCGGGKFEKLPKIRIFPVNSLFFREFG